MNSIKFTIPGISIHAAQEGCDSARFETLAKSADFNPRSPRGLRQRYCVPVMTAMLFQSTQPKRAATNGVFCLVGARVKFQSTQPKRAATYRKGVLIPSACYFNPRSPRGLRPEAGLMRETNYIFQSTQPKRAATLYFDVGFRDGIISIHAAQEGCDLTAIEFINVVLTFQSTQPKRAATARGKCIICRHNHFNPRSPRGLRPATAAGMANALIISIHAAQEGCD